MDELTELRERIVKLEYRVDRLDETFKTIFDKMLSVLEKKLKQKSDTNTEPSTDSFYYER